MCRIRKSRNLWLLNFQVTLASAATAHGQVKELEKENSDQMYHVHKLRGTVKQLEEMLCETNRMCNMLKQVSEIALALEIMSMLQD